MNMHHKSASLGNKSKIGSKDQDLIQSSTTPNPGYQIGMLRKKIKHRKQEPGGSQFLEGDHKTAVNRRKSTVNTRHT